MADQRLVEYIKSELSRGVSAEQIRQILLEIGWQESDINEALGLINQPTAQQSAQQPEITAAESATKKEKTVKSRKSAKSKKTAKMPRKIGKISKKSAKKKVPVKAANTQQAGNDTNTQQAGYDTNTQQAGNDTNTQQAGYDKVAQVAEQHRRLIGIQPVIETQQVDVQITAAQIVQSSKPIENASMQTGKAVENIQTDNPIDKSPAIADNKNNIKEQTGKSNPLSLDPVKVINRVRSKKFIMTLGAMMTVLVFVGVFTFYTIGSGVPSAKFTKENVQAEAVPDAVLQELDAAMEESVQQSVLSNSVQDTNTYPLSEDSQDTQQLNLIDCGFDMDCFVQVSYMCEPAVVTDEASSGANAFRVQYKLLGIDGNECRLGIARDNGISGECRADTYTLSNMLMRWSSDIYSTDDKTLGNCQGEYFN